MRTHYCGELSAALVERTVTLCGWAHRRRDHGGVIFIDLRDREGLAQVVCDPDRADAFAAAERVRSEFVLRVTGKVRRRPEGTVNPELRSGEMAADAIVEGLKNDDTSGAQLGKWGEVFNEGVDRMRRLVCEYYDGFSFGRFVKRYPHLKGHLTDLLIGDLFKDSVDEVIEPKFTRQKLIRALRLLENKRDSNPRRKHGNIPL